MSFLEKFTGYQNLPELEKLDNYDRLIQSALSFLEIQNKDKHQAIELSKAIMAHRELMGSSKKYEMATELDEKLAFLGLDVARIGYEHDPNLIPYLEGALYYTTENRRTQLENEIAGLKKM